MVTLLSFIVSLFDSIFSSLHGGWLVVACVIAVLYSKPNLSSCSFAVARRLIAFSKDA